MITIQKILPSRFGFIVMDGNGALFGTLQGNTRDVLHKFTVDLPKKHGRGGQSALRYFKSYPFPSLLRAQHASCQGGNVQC